MGDLADVDSRGWGRRYRCWSASLLLGCLVAAAVLGSDAPALAQRPAGREGTRDHVANCHVPDVRGYALAYARELIDESHCAVGTIAPARHSPRNLVVLGESPRPGTRGPAGRRVHLRLGPRPRGCRAHHFHALAQTAGLDVWTEVFGDPYEPEDAGAMLEACVPPAGPIVTVSVASGGEFQELRTAGHTIAFIETHIEQQGTNEELVAFDLDRTSTGPGCGISRGYEHCLLREGVEDAGPQPAEPFGQYFAVGLVGAYAVDASGDIAWIQDYQSTRRALYILTAQSKNVVKVTEGDLADVSLSSGELTWTAGGQARKEDLATLA